MKSEVISVKCSIVRGGTSKGIFILENELPSDPALRDQSGIGSCSFPPRRWAWGWALPGGQTAKPIVDLIQEGNQVVIAHGNGPQVGMVNLGMSTAAEAGAIKSDMPFPECGAMSQGYISASMSSASLAEAKSLSITAGVPSKRPSFRITGIPPPPAAITTWPVSMSAAP